MRVKCSLSVFCAFVTFRQVPCYSADVSFFEQGFVLHPPRKLGDAPGALAMDLFVFWCNHTCLRRKPRDLISIFLLPFEQISLDKNYETHIPIIQDPSEKTAECFTSLFLDFFAGLRISLNVSESEYFVIFASGFSLFNKDTRKGANNYMTDSYFFFPLRKFRSGILSLALEGLLLRELIFLSVSPSQSASSLLVQKRTIIFLVSDRVFFLTTDPDWNYMSLSSNIVQLSFILNYFQTFL